MGATASGGAPSTVYGSAMVEQSEPTPPLPAATGDLPPSPVPAAEGPPATTDPEALLAQEAALRAENERLRSENEQLRTVGTTARRHRVRGAAAAVLAAATAVLLVLSVLSVWTTRTALNTDTFVARVGPVINQPAVQAEVSTAVGTELVSVLNVQSRLAPVLPSKLAFLAGPIASGVDSFVQKQVTAFVATPLFSQLWYQALRVAHTAVVTALTGNSADVQVVNGKIVVNLIGVVNQVLSEISKQLPQLFGHTVALALPTNLPQAQIAAQVQKYLGVTLPPNFASIPIADAGTLEAARTGVRVVNVSVVLLVVLALACLVGAVAVSPRRRRTLLQIGLVTAALTAALFFALRAFGRATISSIADPTLRAASQSASHVLFATLRTNATVLFWCAVVLALVCYLIGPGRWATALRRQVERGWRALSTAVRAEGTARWTARHLDVLRVGGLVVAAVVLLVWTSWAALVVVGILLVLFEVGVTLLARASPAGAGGDGDDDGGGSGAAPMDEATASV